MVEVRAEWKVLNEDQKAFYKEMMEKEKVGLGDNYRRNRSRKKDEPVSEPKRHRAKKVKKVKAPEPKQSTSYISEISILMKQMKDLDSEIKETEEEVDNLRSVKLEESVTLAVSKNNLKVKTDNKIVLKKKYCNLLN